MARRPLTKRDAIWIAVATVLLAAAGLVVAFVLGLGDPAGDSFSVRGVMPLGDGTLVFVERSGQDNSTYDRGRLRVIARDGRELRRSDNYKRALVGHAVVGSAALPAETRAPVSPAAGHVWISHPGGALAAWRVADLRPVPGASAAIEAHPMLSRKRVVVGVAGQAIVVRAADDALYTIDPSYMITKQAKGFAYAALPPRSESVDQFPAFGGHAHVRGQRIDLRGVDLRRPTPVIGADGQPLSVDDGLFVHSTDFEGLGSSSIVSRVDLEGQLRWSTTLRDLVGAHGLGRDARSRLVYADLHAGALWVVVEAGVWHPASANRKRGYGEYEIRIAELDPSTGAVRRVHRVAG